MSKEIFSFKNFSVAQDRCAMKIGTDAVLLGALCSSTLKKNILDIGTGTGIVALMLAQDSEANLTGIDIEKNAAQQAQENFSRSPFAGRLKSVHSSFEEYNQMVSANTFDLIVSNPPYFLDSLKTESQDLNLAKHSSPDYFRVWLLAMKRILTEDGEIEFIYPPKEGAIFIEKALEIGFFLRKEINIHSFKDKPVKRKIIRLSKKEGDYRSENFVIYENVGEYTEQYKDSLKDFFLKF